MNRHHKAAGAAINDVAPNVSRPVGRPRKSGNPVPAGQKRVRMTVDFPPTTSERLDTIKEAIEASSYIDVLRSALRFYEAAVLAHKRGGRIVIVEADGTRTDWTPMVAA